MTANIAKNTGIYALSALLPQLANLVLMPLYTRFLSLEEFGTVAMVISFGAFTTPLMGLQLNESFRRFYFDLDAKGARSYFSTVLFAMLGISAAVGLGLWGTAGWWWPKLSGITGLPAHPYLELGLLLALLSSLTALGINALVIEERSGAMLGLALFRTSLNVGVTVLLVVLLRKGAAGMLLGQIAGLGGTLAAALLLNRHFLTFRFDGHSLREGFRYSLPLFPHALGIALIGYADRIILGQFTSLKAIGLYDFADRIAKVFYQAVFAGDRAVTPVFLRKATRGREIAVSFFRKFIVRWTVVYGVLLLGISLYARHLLELVIAPAYHGAYLFVPILCLAYLARGYSLFGIKQLMFAKKTGMFPVITLISSGVNIAGNILLIPRYGIVAAAWMTVAAALCALLLARFWGQRLFPIDYNERETLPVLTAVVAALIMGSVVQLEGVWADLLLKTLMIGCLAAGLWVSNAGGCRSWKLQELFPAAGADD